jgi:copper chaperone CopZ
MNKTIIVIIAALMAFSSAAFAADNSLIVSEAQAQKTKKAKAEVKEVNFHVHLHCANCVEKVKAHIAFEKGVKDLNVTTHSIAMKYDATKTSEAALKAAIEKLGYKIIEGEDHHHHHHN